MLKLFAHFATMGLSGTELIPWGGRASREPDYQVIVDNLVTFLGDSPH